MKEKWPHEVEKMRVDEEKKMILNVRSVNSVAKKEL